MRGAGERWDQVCERPAKCPEMAMGTRLRDKSARVPRMGGEGVRGVGKDDRGGTDWVCLWAEEGAFEDLA